MQRYRRFVERFLLSGALLAAMGLAGPAALVLPTAQAGTTSLSGTAVAISGIDNLAATSDSYARGNIGKIFGLGLGFAGMAIIAAGRAGIGAMALFAGVGAAFIPDIAGTAFSSAAGAPLDVVTMPHTPWWGFEGAREPVLGMPIGRLSP